MVALGGALGAICRYAINLLAQRYLVSPYWGTLLANILGCLVIGLAFRLFTVHASTPGTMPESLRLLVITGLLGALTTFSTFSLETIHLAQHGRWGMAALNVVLSVVICLVAVLAGLTLGFTSNLPLPPLPPTTP